MSLRRSALMREKLLQRVSPKSPAATILKKNFFQVIEKSAEVTSFNWLIDNFNKDFNGIMQSPSFSLKSDPNLKFSIMFFKYGGKYIVSDYPNSKSSTLPVPKSSLYSLFLNIDTFTTDFSIPHKLEFSIKDDKGLTISKSLVIKSATEDDIGFSNFISEEELLKCIIDSQLYCLKIGIDLRPVKIDNSGFTTFVKKNFESFLYNEALSDVVFNICGHKYPAHKVILSSASSVFEKMFSIQMKENITNNVEMQETDPTVFQEMLRFIYTGKVTNLKNIALKLYESAKMYDISELSAACEKYLLNTLSVENVIQILEIADSHNSVSLKQQCIYYVDKHFENVQETDSFKTLNRDLLMDLLCAIRIKKKRTE